MSSAQGGSLGEFQEWAAYQPDVVHNATGVLMIALGADADTARYRLISRAEQLGVELVDLARQVVDNAARAEYLIDPRISQGERVRGGRP